MPPVEIGSFSLTIRYSVYGVTLCDPIYTAITLHLSSPYATPRELPLSQCTWMVPMSSTHTTVPFVPGGGACRSFISTNSTLIPGAYWLRRHSSLAFEIPHISGHPHSSKPRSRSGSSAESFLLLCTPHR